MGITQFAVSVSTTYFKWSKANLGCKRFTWNNGVY